MVRSLVEWGEGEVKREVKGTEEALWPRHACCDRSKGTEYCNRDRVVGSRWQHWWATAKKRWSTWCFLIRCLAGYVAITGLYKIFYK